MQGSGHAAAAVIAAPGPVLPPGEARPPFIVTLQLAASIQAVLDGLRRQHFPPDRNFLAAHVTLFHALPAAGEELVKAGLRQLGEKTSAFPVHLPGVRFLGRGSAVRLESLELLACRARLATDWAEWLTPQDRQKFQPHVTVQNKVAPAVARALFDELQATWQPVTTTAESLRLWRYLGGPWELEQIYPFQPAA